MITIKKTNDIVLIIPYFGKLPLYFPYFIESVRDKNIDILFITNSLANTLSFPIPDNIKWQQIDFESIKILINHRFKFEVSLANPYKFCDIKPFLGFIFEEYIKEYTFWGSIDIDLIVGDFNKFITNELLSSIDFYSGIKEYVSGSFFLVRNNQYCNRLFEKSKDWQRVLKTPGYLGFDECGGAFFKELKQGVNIQDLSTNVQSFTEIIIKEEKSNILRVRRENSILEPKKEIVYIDKKKRVVLNAKEYLIIHFIYLKTRYYFIIPHKKINTPFYVCELGFFKTKPSFFTKYISFNFSKAIQKKISINLKKILPCYLVL